MKKKRERFLGGERSIYVIKFSANFFSAFLILFALFALCTRDYIEPRDCSPSSENAQ